MPDALGNVTSSSLVRALREAHKEIITDKKKASMANRKLMKVNNKLRNILESIRETLSESENFDTDG